MSTTPRAQPTLQRTLSGTPALRPIIRRTLRGALVLAVLVAAGARARRWSSHVGRGDVATATVATQAFQRRVTADGTLRAVKATEVVVPETPGMWITRKLAWLAPDGSAVQAGDVILRFDPSDADKQLREAQADLESAEARLRQEQLRAAATTADRKAAAARAREEADQARQFQAKDPQIYSRNEIIVAEIDERLAAARQVQAEVAEHSNGRMARSNVELLAIARQRCQLALDHARAALANMAIRAPNDGILVLRRDDHGDLPKLGAQLYANHPVADLPVPGQMEAELYVLEVDGTGLEVGQPADVVVTSRPDLVFHGKIRLVDKLAKPRQAWVPVQFISVVVELDRTDHDVMKPGQRVRATLAQGGQDALVVPRQAVFEHEGKSIVYRGGPHGFAPVTVELGPASAGRVAITSGLAAGDVIALRDPTRSVDLAIGNTAAGGSAGSTTAPSNEAP